MFIKRDRYEHLIAENKRLEETLQEAEDRFENFLKDFTEHGSAVLCGKPKDWQSCEKSVYFSHEAYKKILNEIDTRRKEALDLKAERDYYKHAYVKLKVEQEQSR